MEESSFQKFVAEFRRGFRPPRPSAGLDGDDWLVSRVWSDYVRDWFVRDFRADIGVLDAGRSNALLWLQGSSAIVPDVALAWMWDNNKVWKTFAATAYEQLFLARASSAVGLVHTRVDGARGDTQANDSIARLRATYQRHAGPGRSAGVIEVRRVVQRVDRVAFDCLAHDFGAGTVERVHSLEYP